LTEALIQRSVLGRGDASATLRVRKYPTELLERGARLVFESGRPSAHVAADLGVLSETLRRYMLGYVTQAEIEAVDGRA
jgi:hypothetical protein